MATPSLSLAETPARPIAGAANIRDALAAEEPRKRRRFNRRIRTAPGGIFGRMKELVDHGVCGPKIERPGSPRAWVFDRPTLVLLIQLNFPPGCKSPWAPECPGKGRSFPWNAGFTRQSTPCEPALSAQTACHSSYRQGSVIQRSGRNSLRRPVAGSGLKQEGVIEALRLR